MNSNIVTAEETKRTELSAKNRAWLKQAKSFKEFLRHHQQKALPIPAQLKEKQALALNQIVVEEYYKRLRGDHYYSWLQHAESLLCLRPEINPLNSCMMRLMMSLDYKKLYDNLLFEFHYYLSRACFCKLAKYYEINISKTILNDELDFLIDHLKQAFADNRDIEHQEDFKELFKHAYRTALIDLCLYHNIDVNVLAEPLFDLAGLMNKSFSVSKTESTIQEEKS